MTTAIKAISGVTGFLTIGGPTAYVGWVAWDGNNPTGDKWLLDSGYSFNKPTTTSQEKLSYGCSENLFATKASVDNEKVYGCALMKMEKTEDNKFVKFNSEVALRKGNEGWVINTLLENYKALKKANGKYTYKFKFGYVFTKKNLQENKTERWFFWGGNDYTRSRLYIKVPKVNESPWYNSGNFMKDFDTDNEHPQINFSSPKEYYGIWISKGDGNAEWIFKNIEFWTNEKRDSEIFCGDTKKCEQSDTGNNYAYKMEDEKINTWFDSGQVTEKKAGDTSTPTGSSILNHINSMIDTIKDIRGDWVDMDEVCGLRWKRNLDEGEKKLLRMYCTNGKKSSK